MYTDRVYEGGITSKVCATSFSHPKRSLPKISAPGWNFLMPSSNNPVLRTILSSPKASC
jgi:hypothetical protein